MIWSGPFAAAVVIQFAVSAVFYLLMSATAVYAVDRFSSGDGLAGTAAGVFMAGSIIARLVTGWLLETVGAPLFTGINLVLFALAGFAYLAAGDVSQLMLVRAVHGFAFGAVNTAVTVIALSLVPVSRLAEGTGYFGVASTAASGLGPVVGVLLVQGHAYETLFLASGVVSLVGVAIAPFLRLRSQPKTSHPALRRPTVRDLIDRTALGHSLIAHIGCLGFSGLLTFLPSYARFAENGEHLAYFFAIYSVAVLVSRLTVGRVQDRYGDAAVLIPAVVAFAAGLFVLTLPIHPALVILAASLVGLGFGTLVPSTQVMVISAVPADRIPVALSTFYLLTDAGIAIGPVVIGFALSVVDYPTAFSALGVLMLAATALYPRGRRSKTNSA